MALMSGVTDTTVKSKSNSASAQAQEDASVNFDTFIKLLAVQLQNQDPMNPMDGTAFTEQLATFSGLEQQIATNAHLEKLVDQEDVSKQTLAVSYIGKDAMMEGNTITLDGDEATFAVALEETAKTAELEIINSQREVVRTVSLKDRTAGVQYISWDGQDDAGNELPKGEYKLRLTAYDDDGTKVVTQTYTYGRVVGVEGDATNPDNTFVKLADGREAKVTEIFGVVQPNVVDPNPSAQALAISYIGKSVLAPGGDFIHDGGTVKVGVDLPSVAGNDVGRKLVIQNEQGETVYEAELDADLEGYQNFTISKDADGNPLPAGSYTVKATIEETEGKYVNAQTYTYGKVKSAEGSGVNISVSLEDGRNVGVYDVRSVQNI